MLTKGLSLLIGPIGMAVTGIWTITDIVSGPAMRVTVPACVIIAYLRKTIMLEKENKLFRKFLGYCIFINLQ